jgi:hypothetical protein
MEISLLALFLQSPTFQICTYTHTFQICTHTKFAHSLSNLPHLKFAHTCACITQKKKTAGASHASRYTDRHTETQTHSEIDTAADTDARTHGHMDTQTHGHGRTVTGPQTLDQATSAAEVRPDLRMKAGPAGHGPPLPHAADFTCASICRPREGGAWSEARERARMGKGISSKTGTQQHVFPLFCAHTHSHTRTYTRTRANTRTYTHAHT